MAFVVSILLLVFSTIAVDALLKECPPFQFKACDCYVTNKVPEVTCSDITDLRSLRSHLEVLKDYYINFILFAAELSELAPDTFQGSHINHLTVDKSEIASPDVLQFQGLEKSLTILEINDGFKKNPLKGLKLGNLQNLESVKIVENIIDDLNNDWFAGGSKKIKTVTVQSNKIRTLGDKAFQSLDGLQTLFLTGNSFGKISRSMFPSNSILRAVYLSHNKIKEISSGSFSNMPNLALVDLTYNLITTIKEDETILKNTLIFFDGNPLKCDKNLEWICKSKVKYNIHTAKCDSPDSMKDYSLQVFCDVAGKED